MSCLFCKIVNKEIPAEIVYEDESAVGILDIHPVAPGHTMILPKRHAATILELPNEEMAGVFHAVKKMTGRLQKVFSPDGFTIGINHGSVSGQTVEHLHIHIFPRFHGDGGGSIHSVVKNPPLESIEVIASKIRSTKS